MHPSAKDMWCEALASHAFRQGQGYLCRADRYSCLGVLCELAYKAGVVKKENDGICERYDGQAAYLPFMVQWWAGLPDDDPFLGHTGRTLTQLNDAGHDFRKLANAIRTYL